ncbi:MAG: GIY-YIG nuclease family protein [Ignavibacteriaceae bacterium]|nr:GIY-YIG nuclease family protein [Ignavibacteriaceae bacterium]
MFYYVYILQSLNFKDTYYVGFTSNIKRRLSEHNGGKSEYTSKYKPWKIKNAIAFDEEDKAIKFEKYLKSHSGRAFIKKHF